ncbi:guanine nucleotide-binding protein subunit beta-1-like [Symsagittifera roscoffensis]|uniref:guanine nucleotide-binding protein subunit beta-1-like n=1 Tax=Symsagittifera roscoffensis TaxID=84072 RepID=UPI00307C0602
MADAAPMENHHPPGTPIVTPATPAGPEATHENENNNAAVDPENEQVQELESELSKLKDKLQSEREAVCDGMLNDTATSLDNLTRVRLKTRRTLNGHAAAIYTMCWRPESHEMVSGSQDGKLLIWDTHTNNKINIITLKCPWVMSSGFAPSGNFVASGGHDNAVSIYGLKGEMLPEKPIAQLTDHNGFISSIRYIDDTQLLCSSGDNSSALWDSNCGTKLTSYEGHTAEVMGLAGSSDNTVFVSGSCDRTAKLWDVRDKVAKQTFTGHDLDINSIAFFPSDRAFVTGSDDNSCKLYDIRSDQAVATYTQLNLNYGIGAVSFSKSGRLLFVACDLDVLIWDTLKSLKVGILSGHEARVSCLGVNSDGNAVCSGSWDAKLKIWN